MIVEYIRYLMVTHSPAQLQDAYREAGAYLQASPHCLSYELTQCAEDPASLILRIEWTSLDGHVDGFRKSAEFRPFLRLIRPYFPEIVEMRHYRADTVVWKRPPP